MTPDQNWLTDLPTRPFDGARVVKLAASAGCGKTFSIERTILELLDDGVSPASIMYVVFNKKPAIEFRSRFPKFSKDDMKWWNTHHTINSHLIRESSLFLKSKNMGKSGQHWDDFGLAYGYDFDGEGDEDSVSKKPEGVLLREAVSLKLYNGFKVETMEADEAKFLRSLREYEHDNRVLSFISMMFNALDADLFPAGIEYVFVDEAQDNGSAQNDYWKRILELHTDVRGFMLAGDDKQAINRFKGGEAEGFLAFPADICVSLKATYRNPPPVLALANQIAAPIENRSPLVSESLAKAKGSVTYHNRFAYIIGDIHACIRNRERVLVLSRHGKFAKIAAGVLAADGVPVERESTDVIRRVLRAFREMRSSGVITSQEIDILNPFRPSGDRGKEGELKITCPYFDKVERKERLKKSELSKAQASFLEEADQLGREPIPIEDAASAGFTDLFVSDVLSGKNPDPSYFFGGEKIAALAGQVLDWITRYGDDYVPVRTSTVHSAKGAEAETVVILTDIYRSQVARERGESDDERRVYYTAVTRSLDRVIIVKITRDDPSTRFL